MSKAIATRPALSATASRQMIDAALAEASAMSVPVDGGRRR
jgi:hypothetical protein